MGYGDFKDLTKRTASDKIFCDKSFNVTNNLKYEISMWTCFNGLHFFFDNYSGELIKNENVSNEEIAEELHKPIIRIFKKGKLHLSFIDNIWVADTVDMHLISKSNKVIYFLLCIIDIFSE